MTDPADTATATVADSLHNDVITKLRQTYLDYAAKVADWTRRFGPNHLAVIKSALGDLDRVERFVKLIGYVNVAPGFMRMPQVVNGASDLFIEIWGERGEHARAAVGVASLSNEAPVETEVTVQIRD